MGKIIYFGEFLFYQVSSKPAGFQQWNNIQNHPGNNQVNGGFHIGFQFHGGLQGNNGFQMQIQPGDFNLQQFGAQLGNGFQEHWNGQDGN